ncbi:MAG: pyruvate formate lyase family protein [Planctomycetota bacterium]
MTIRVDWTRRHFLAGSGAVIGAAGLAALSRSALAARTAETPHADIAALRRAVVSSPLRVGHHRAEVFTRVFQQREDKPWVLRKALALREYFETVPLYVRNGDQIAGSISELPGSMPVMVELGIGENDIYTGERPDREGYLARQVDDDIRDYWKNRNAWGLYRTEILKQSPYTSADQVPRSLQYKFISNQGHLSPSYGRLLEVGLQGLLHDVETRAKGESEAEAAAFLSAAENVLRGLSAWSQRYSEHLAREARECNNAARTAQLREMSRITGKIATEPPETFREALQLIWLAHQAIHIEGHGYSCTPDHIDQLLLPYYEADLRAGRLNDDETLRLAENFVLKQYDNSFWGPEHHLTQGLCVSGSTPDGRSLTNRLSWHFVEAHTNLVLPEPLLWVRWHPEIDQKFFDFCLSRLTRSTCFPMLWSDAAIPQALMELGIAKEDAFNYLPVGCNELAVPGQWYYNPGAGVSYLPAVEAALTSGKGYRGQWKWQKVAPPVEAIQSFDQFTEAVGSYVRRSLEQAYENNMQILEAQMRWGQTPLTSCFFDGCIDRGRDMAIGTKYNFLSCGGTAFANAVDCLAAIREVVFEKKEATLADVAAACKANFKGYERLRAKLQAAPKQGNDDPQLDDVIRLVERLRDEPMKEICRDPRDGSQFGNSHVVRSSAVRSGRTTPATPDGRLAGVPLASSVAASVGCERNGPTAVLNSVAKLNSSQSWQCGYQVNIRFHAGMIADEAQRAKLRAMLNGYFRQGGQELQINVVDTATLRAAQKDPDAYRDLVVRVAGFSEFFVNLTPDMQEDIIARTEHM